MITIDGRLRPINYEFAAMISTLRLELGAFLAEVTGAINATFISSEHPTLLKLQGELEQALMTNFDSSIC